MDTLRAQWRRSALGTEPFNPLFPNEKARHRSKHGRKLRTLRVRRTYVSFNWILHA